MNAGIFRRSFKDQDKLFAETLELGQLGPSALKGKLPQEWGTPSGGKKHWASEKLMLGTMRFDEMWPIIDVGIPTMNNYGNPCLATLLYPT